MWTNTLFGFSLFGTLRHGKTDAAATGHGQDHHEPIAYPKPDGKLSFDRLTNVAFCFTNHEESQPCAPEAEGSGDPDRRSTCRNTPSRRSATARPGSTRFVGERRGRTAVPDQLPELRPLQDLRHQGPEPEHRLDHAAGRRRAELSQYVSTRAAKPARSGARCGAACTLPCGAHALGLRRRFREEHTPRRETRLMPDPGDDPCPDRAAPGAALAHRPRRCRRRHDARPPIWPAARPARNRLCRRRSISTPGAAHDTDNPPFMEAASSSTSPMGNIDRGAADRHRPCATVGSGSQIAHHGR